jgi:predicted phosphodiesterase
LVVTTVLNWNHGPLRRRVRQPPGPRIIFELQEFLAFYVIIKALKPQHDFWHGRKKKAVRPRRDGGRAGVPGAVMESKAAKRDGIPHEAVGLMADSHGEAGAIWQALDLFAARGCARIYHLGDICDSAHPETAAACLEPLRRRRVVALKGNNDHAAARLLLERGGSAELAQRLAALPLSAHWRGAQMVHSLPFVEELGAAGLIGSMGVEQALRLFERSHHALVFRGHGHTPEMIWYRDAQVRVERLSAGDCIDLSLHRPCVLTCGALSSGFCMIWHPARRQAHCLALAC